MLVNVEFGKDAFNYLRRQLACSRTLWRVLAELDLDAGCIFGYFPKQFPAERLSEFSDSLLKRGEPNGDMVLQANRCLYQGLKGYLANRDQVPRVAIGGCPWMVNDEYPPRMFEYWNLTWMADRRADYERRNKQTAPMTSACLVDRYTYQPAGQELTEEGFRALWEFQPFWNRMCVLSACENPRPLHREVGHVYLTQAAEAAECILLNAYDGDAPLVWFKTKEFAKQFHKDAVQTPSDR